MHSPHPLLARLHAVRRRMAIMPPPPAPHPYAYTFDASGVLHRTLVSAGTIEHEAIGGWQSGRYVSPARTRTETIGPFSFAEDGSLLDLQRAHAQRKQGRRDPAHRGSLLDPDANTPRRRAERIGPFTFGEPLPERPDGRQ